MPFVLLFIFIGLPWHIQGQSSIITVNSRFLNGDLKLTWNFSTSLISPYVYISDIIKTWNKVTDSEYTVKNVLLYEIVYIDVIDRAVPIEGYEWSYKVLKVKEEIGKLAKLQWTATFFPASGLYSVFHMHNNNHPIIRIDKATVLYQGQGIQSSKYVYLSKPHNSENISFEIRNITVDDAGYYNSGVTTEAAESGGGVVLIVYAKPKKPKIFGNFNIQVDAYADLACSSNSTSAPDYYQKISALSYTWFENSTTIGNQKEKTLRLKVTKDHKFNNYSCMATEVLQSDRSDTVQINPLYGPKNVYITSESNDVINEKIIVKEGDLIGPLWCQTDCNPPCNISWTYENLDKPVEVVSSKVEIEANRSISQLQCVAKGEIEQIARNISIDIQYFDKPVLFINETHLFNGVLEVHENTEVRFSCFVDGNPIPSIHLRNGSRNLVMNKRNSKWANYTLVSAQCNNSDTFFCTGNSTVFNVREQLVKIDVMCNLRIDFSSPSFKNNYASTSGKTVKVAVAIPVIANPPPRAFDIKWVGPTEHPVNSIISKQEVAYKYWINASLPVYDHPYFGNYTIKYRNDTLLLISINAQDRPATPINFTGYSYNGGNINLTWVPGFNGGSEQFFIISKRNDIEWEMVANITENGKDRVIYIETGPFRPGQDIWYRLKSCNKINCSIQSTEIKVHVKALSNGLLLGLNNVTFVAIGISATLLILSVIFVVVLVKYFQRKTKRNYHNVETENDIAQGAEMYAVVDKSEPTKNNSKDEAETSGKSGDKNECKRKSAGEMYAAVDKGFLKGNKTTATMLDSDNTNEKEDGIQHGAEMYAVVDKNLLKKGGESKPRTNLVTVKKSKKKNKGKHGSLEETNKSSVGSRRTNDEGLIYIDLEFTNRPGSSDTNQTPVIHGEEDRTEYTFVDFSKKAPPTPEPHDNKGK